MKWAGWYIAVLVVVLILQACNSGNSSISAGKSPNRQDEVSTNGSETNPTEKPDIPNFQKEGFPIVNEPITLQFLTGKHPATAEDYNQVEIWKKYEKMTNIHIDWGLTLLEGLNEKRNLLLANGDYPEVLYSARVPTNDLLKYGQQGIFIPLNDLIQDYMPNLRKILEDYPDIKKGITFPDGNIYSLPTIYSPDFGAVLINSIPWIRQDWLDALNMEMPATTEQFYQYLKAVKERDPNGNNLADEIPYGEQSFGSLLAWLKGSFGLNNRGVSHAHIDLDPDSKELRFIPTSDRYKGLLEYMHRLYSEGLIEQNVFSMTLDQYLASGSMDLYGSTVLTDPERFGQGKAEPYVAIPQLMGPHGDRTLNKVGSALAGMGAFVITDKNKHPEATVRWMDYFYGEEGRKLYFMGIEGESFEETADGNYQYLDHINNHPDGLSQHEALKPFITWLGGGYPGFVDEKHFKGYPDRVLEKLRVLEPEMVEEVWAPFTYTEEESKTLTGLGLDIEKYVAEMTAGFVSGSVPFSEWDNYVRTIERMGLETYMNVQQAAYDRYRNS